eukprot:SAG22_NODE_525_length_9470_cov_21.475936_4_plen_279_part_00
MLLEAQSFFAARAGRSLPAALDNAQHYHGLLNETVRLDSLHFSALGGDLEAADMRAWARSLDGSGSDDEELVGIELAELSSLVEDPARRAALHTAIGDYLTACRWDAPTGGHPAPVLGDECSGRGLCEVASASCLCDIGFYPEDLNDASPPCQLRQCPYASNVECAGHGECDGHTGACTCNAHFQGADCSADVDECAQPGNECIVGNRACRNVYGSYSCGHCVEGYEQDAHELCADVDECAHENGGCHGLQCVNEAGSYRCGQCDEGFRPAEDNPAVW